MPYRDPVKRAAQDKIRRATPKYKAAERVRNATPERKAANRAVKHTQEYKDGERVRRASNIARGLCPCGKTRGRASYECDPCLNQRSILRTGQSIQRYTHELEEIRERRREAA